MFDDQVQDTLTEIVQPEAAVEAPVEQKPEEKPQESLKEYNMRTLRERAESEKKAREAAEKRIKELEAMQMNNQQQYAPSQPSADLNLGLEDGDIIEYKHVKQLLQAERKRNDEHIARLNQQSEEQMAEQRLKAQYADFEQVLTKDNMETLRMIDPEAHASIVSNPTIYGKAKTAYNIIKRFGIVDNTTDYSAADRRAEQNRPKTKAAATMAPQTNDSPLSRTSDYDRRVLTDSDRERIMKAVEEAKRARA